MAASVLCESLFVAGDWIAEASNMLSQSKTSPARGSLVGNREGSLDVGSGRACFQHLLQVGVGDHSPLQFINQMVNMNQKQLPWSIELQHYYLDICNRPGRLNLLPDSLSRPPSESFVCFWSGHLF